MSTAESRAEPSPLPIGTVIDGYRIEQVLGRGGMGFVYGAINTMIGKRAALKVLRSELGANQDVLSRFITEARAVNQIGHPNIVDIFGFGTIDDDQPYMVMEWLRGETLGSRMKRPLTHAEACELLLAIASALEAAHAAGIAHRDLKPENVFLTSAGRLTTVKLLDFGIAKLLTSDQSMEKTQTGMVMGTPAYMSPEQARGKDVDQRTDLYSLGIIAFEMFCGRAPFIGETAMDLVVAHIHQAAPAPSSVASGITPAIDNLVLSLLEKDAAARPTMQQVMLALEDIRAGSPHTASLPPRRPTPFPNTPYGETPLPYLATVAPSLVPQPMAAPRKRPWWLALVVALGVLGGAVVTVLATRGDRGDATAEAPPAPAEPVAAITPPAPAPTLSTAPAPVPTPAPAPDLVTIELTSRPAGARVRIAGTTEILGTTPMSKAFPRSDEPVKLELELDGYKLATQQITPAKDTLVQVALTRAPARRQPVVKKKKRTFDRSGTMNVFDE